MQDFASISSRLTGMGSQTSVQRPLNRAVANSKLPGLRLLASCVYLGVSEGWGIQGLIACSWAYLSREHGAYITRTGLVGSYTSTTEALFGEKLPIYQASLLAS